MLGLVGRVGLQFANGSFSPAALFSAGEVGAWYDPSDFSTMFQDSAGTTPVTAVEQPVGLLLDKSKSLAVGSNVVINGNFSTDTVWSKGAGWTISGGAAQWGGGADAFLQQPIAITDGWYKITFTVTGRTIGTVDLRVINNLSNSLYTAPTNGTFVVYGYGVTASANVAFRSVSLNAGAAVSNVSVVSVAGNHASQATSASQPVLSAKVNQLLATATLSTQSVTTLAATYTLAFSGTGTVTATGTNIGVYSAGSNSLVCTAGTLTLTVVGSVTLADLRVTNDGVGLPAYQAVVTSTNYDTSGFPLYLKFDGVDDSLATGTITPGIDKAQVFAGVRKLSDAAIQILYETSTTTSANALSSLPSYSGSGAVVGPYWSVWSSSVIFATPATYPAPQTVVQTHVADISAPNSTLRINGIQAATSSASQGTGNYLAYPLYIGRRGGTLYPFKGNLYGLIVRFGANLDATTISNTETWVNGKTKAY